MREAGLDVQFILIRSPMPSVVERVVEFADVDIGFIGHLPAHIDRVLITHWPVFHAAGEKLQAQDGVTGVVYTPDGHILSSSMDHTLRLWRFSPQLAALIAWTEANRYVRPLTCSV